jgi:hypothetical protein
VQIEHPNARNWWTTNVVAGNNRKKFILVVETDLITDSREEGFDIRRYVDLLDAIIDAMVKHPEIRAVSLRKIYLN